MRKAEAAKADVLIVKIRHVSIGNVRAVNANVYQNAGRTAQPLCRVDDIWRRGLYHADKVWKRYRRDQRIIICNKPVGEAEFARSWIDCNKLVVELDITFGDKLVKVKAKTAIAW